MGVSLGRTLCEKATVFDPERETVPVREYTSLGFMEGAGEAENEPSLLKEAERVDVSAAAAEALGLAVVLWEAMGTVVTEGLDSREDDGKLAEA